MLYLTPTSSIAEILKVVNELHDKVIQQEKEIASLKQSQKQVESNLKVTEEKCEEISQNAEKCEEVFSELDLCTSQVQKNSGELETLRSQVSANREQVELSTSENQSLKQELEEASNAKITFVEELQGEILKNRQGIEDCLREHKKSLQHSIDTFEKSKLNAEETLLEMKKSITSINTNIQNEAKSTQRKLGIFQKQEKVLLSMLTDLKTNFCDITDNINEMNYKQTIDAYQSRLRRVEIRQKQKILNVSNLAPKDLGILINNEFERNQDLQSLELRLEDGIYSWDVPVVLKPHVFLKITAPNRRHGYIHKKRKRDGDDCEREDVQRCPAIINMHETREVNKKHYENQQVYYRLKLDHYCIVTLDGLTINEAIGEIDGRQVYVPGVFLLTGSYCSLRVQNSRVSFGSELFINGHGVGEKHCLMAHTRFVRNSSSLNLSARHTAVLGTHRGKGFLGRRLLISGTDVVCEQGIRQYNDDENIVYLY